MTRVGPGTYEAARAAVAAAFTAADRLAAGEARAAYACSRPPGHHVTRSAYGGSCYLDNAAAPAAKLLARVGGPVALVDIDAHHGSGTQAVFCRRAAAHRPRPGWRRRPDHDRRLVAETLAGCRRR
jgi:acetoin utilization deacetylase AcuC-like enzyme